MVEEGKEEMQDTRQMSDAKLATEVLRHIISAGPEVWATMPEDIKTLRMAVGIRLRGIETIRQLGFEPEDKEIVAVFKEFMQKVEVQDVS